MRMVRYVLAACLMIMVSGKASQAAGYVDNLDVRPDIGYGYAFSKDHERGMGYHAGVRILSSVRTLSTSEPDKRWGMEISSISPFESKKTLSGKKYVSVGLIVEQVLPAQIVITIGTLGYIGVDKNKNNPFGLIADFAWEPRIREHVSLHRAAL